MAKLNKEWKQFDHLSPEANKLQDRVHASYKGGKYLEALIFQAFFIEVLVRGLIQDITKGQKLERFANAHVQMDFLIDYLEFLNVDYQTVSDLRNYNDLRNDSVHKILLKFVSLDEFDAQVKTAVEKGVKVTTKIAEYNVVVLKNQNQKLQGEIQKLKDEVELRKLETA